MRRSLAIRTSRAELAEPWGLLPSWVNAEIGCRANSYPRLLEKDDPQKFPDAKGQEHEGVRPETRDHQTHEQDQQIDHRPEQAFNGLEDLLDHIRLSLHQRRLGRALAG